ncbi:hypothetical protein SacazDRAFT_04223 [Saccharomonospora azurea NA-128]|uniref:DUF218 domain-containing protein n=1 Tax=Saccharomonospora azurea NA-128 TaxID=882081 RepID=H8GFN7_9PSEU|nr:hypothetical protein SacazDRAFT_04223 [Saccharomonospora azurea NA-128]
MGIVLVGLLIVGGTAFRVWHVARADERPAADAIVVLGAAQYNGRPSEIFQARLAHAQQLYEQGVAGVIVTTGGMADGDTFTEADAGANWLRGQGVPAGALLSVGEGNDTLRSIRAAADVIKSRGWSDVVIVSDPWHSLRAGIMAEDSGLTVATSPTHSGPIVQTRSTQARYILRETAALLYYRVSKNPADHVNLGL